MWRFLAAGIFFVGVVTVGSLWWIYAHPSSSTDGLAIIFLPLYAVGPIFGLFLLASIVQAFRSGRDLIRAYRRDQRRI